MKRLFILSITVLYLFSCGNPKKKLSLIELLKRDSIAWANKLAIPVIRADSIFPGFMDLKWNSSKKEAIEYFKNSNELKVDFIASNGNINLKGSFAGGKVKSLTMYYFNDKLYEVLIDFGCKSDVLYQPLLEILELKYGKAIKTEKLCAWNFGFSTLTTNHPKIYLNEDDKGLTLSFQSKYSREYLMQHLKDINEKNLIKLKNS